MGFGNAKMMNVKKAKFGNAKTMNVKTAKFGKSKGKGGRQAGATPKSPKSLLRNTPAEKKAWISGLPEGLEKAKKEKASKDLQKHLSRHGIKCLAAEVWKNGNGSAVFASKKDAAKALEKLNGSDFRGNPVELDVWTTKET